MEKNRELIDKPDYLFIVISEIPIKLNKVPHINYKNSYLLNHSHVVLECN